MAADITVLAQDIVTLLTTEIADSSVDVSRDYRKIYDLGKIEGKAIVVFPLNYLSGEPLDRSADYYDVSLSVIFVERYTEPGDPPEEWIDERVEFFEIKIFNLLSDARREGGYGSSGEYWAQFAVTDPVCDFKLLKQNKTFWSELEVTFRKAKS